MKPSMAPEEIAARLAAASDMSDLGADRRLEAKIDLSTEGVTARLREASDLLELCRKLAHVPSTPVTSDMMSREATGPPDTPPSRM
jgi:hypothetical protein